MLTTVDMSIKSTDDMLVSPAAKFRASTPVTKRRHYGYDVLVKELEELKLETDVLNDQAVRDVRRQFYMEDAAKQPVVTRRESEASRTILWDACAMLTAGHDVGKLRKHIRKSVDIREGPIRGPDITCNKLKASRSIDKNGNVITTLSDGRAAINYYPLSVPRTVKIATCEMCTKKAVLKCNDCRVTYYCGVEHFKGDSKHDKICDMLEFARAEPEFVSSQLERDRLQMLKTVRQHDVAQTVLWSALFSFCSQDYGKADLVFNQAMRLVKGIFGNGSIEMAGVFLVKSRCSAELGKLEEAAKEMGAGVLCIEEHADLLEDNVDIMADLNLTEALLHIKKCEESMRSMRRFSVEARQRMKRPDWDTARHFLSEAIYYTTITDGPDSIRTAPLYFQMGTIFTGMDNTEVALTFYAHSLQNYLEWLLIVFEDKKNEMASREISKGLGGNDVVTLPIQFLGDAIKNLKRLLAISNFKGKALYGKCLLCISILFFVQCRWMSSEMFADESFHHLPTTSHLQRVSNEVRRIAGKKKDQSRLSLVRAANVAKTTVRLFSQVKSPDHLLRRESMLAAKAKEADMSAIPKSPFLFAEANKSEQGGNWIDKRFSLAIAQRRNSSFTSSGSVISRDDDEIELIFNNSEYEDQMQRPQMHQRSRLSMDTSPRRYTIRDTLEREETRRLSQEIKRMSMVQTKRDV